MLPGYDTWKLEAPTMNGGPGFTYDPTLDDEICNHCGKPQATNGPGCTRCNDESGNRK